MNYSTQKHFLYAIIAGIVYSSCNPVSFASRAVPDDLIVHPVSVTLMEGSDARGSGFYFNNDNKAIYFISACHVFMEKDKTKKTVPRCKKATLLSYPKSLDWSQPIKIEIDIGVLLQKQMIRFNSGDDTFAIQIAQQLTNSSNMSVNRELNIFPKEDFWSSPKKILKNIVMFLLEMMFISQGFHRPLGSKKFHRLTITSLY